MMMRVAWGAVAVPPLLSSPSNTKNRPWSQKRPLLLLLLLPAVLTSQKALLVGSYVPNWVNQG